SVYASLLGERIDKHKTDVFLVNTGWIGGEYGTGSRMKLAYTRAMVSAALNGTLSGTEYTQDPIFKVDIPKAVPNVPSDILNPENTWEDKEKYTLKAKELAYKFSVNFSKFKGVSESIKKAGPVA
ncbi:phosphoenolpyruvate carboxykinase (ATP), partial [Clostridium sp.]|uniref:phosphoenolpyruvate carboxykinase (ATP) n=1 Tax=Clostridium sp. TaxID=1506 RepID=UPI001A4E2420